MSPAKEFEEGFVFFNSTKKIVVARGNPQAQLMIIGEAPGAKEDEIGKPFVGRSGKLLDKLLQNVGIDINQDVYFCNVVKCRPPKNRRPTKTEIKENLPWLYQQIKLVNPLVIVLVGATALEAILKIKSPISILRGKWINWEERLVMPVFHPSYLLRNPSKEEGTPMSLTKLDFLKIKEKIDFL
ncbi:uracil-DNA glycosylase [Prochlorococcus marinus XMU1408]|uniref:Type-4 uracil-DNA glycosylase n=1 Tax=Prochlorococcus marinus XMU1408 TaxID=2213228 RepID=A0A318R596_PROMR|nr:uracil-DNA glycosylase [Prochlorococcus marinus]MBW3041700.1 uracil-DNA glycosylase [Prochlorococcus marinus str. XMU1408]PYE03274.1 uracil-DNA glycosylase [Prochlorococcus marinus XMU1408]